MMVSRQTHRHTDTQTHKQLLNRRAASRYTTLQMSEYTTNERHDAKLHNSDTHTQSNTSNFTNYWNALKHKIEKLLDLQWLCRPTGAWPVAEPKAASA